MNSAFSAGRRVVMCWHCCSNRRWKNTPVFGGAHRTPDFQFHEMLTAVVHQGDRFHGKFFSVEKELICAGRISREPADRYMINGLPVAVVDFVGRPAFRQTGSQTQLISREVHAQQGFDQQPIHYPTHSGHARLRKRLHRLIEPSAPGKTTPPAPAGGGCPATATVGPFFPAKPASGTCDRFDRCTLATAAKKNRKPCLTRADEGAELPKMNPTQKQFSLNRAASKKQIPISEIMKTRFSKLVRFLSVLFLAVWAVAPCATAQPRPSLGLQFSAGQPTLSLTGAAGTVYSIQYATDLSPTNLWVDRTLLQAKGASNVWSDPSAPTPGQRFYRAVSVPAPADANLVFIQPGTFTMGSPTNEAERDTNQTQHLVTISRGFWIGKFLVTQGDYLGVVGSNPSYFTSANGYSADLTRPVETVNWIDASNYCAMRTQQERAGGLIPTNYVYRLPTESEWEDADRAGTT